MIVLDTSALFYLVFDPSKMTPSALQAVGNSDSMIVNAISLWELGLKVQRKKLQLPITVRELAFRLADVDGMRIQPTNLDIWLHSLDLDWSHRDPTDRVIVAAADMLGCPLISSDQRIQKFYHLTIW